LTNYRINVSTVAAQYLCNSCGACFAICANGSVRYSETVGGYLFPQIDQRTCIHCGLCYDVCPGINFGKTLTTRMPEDPFAGNVLSCEIGRCTDDAIFSNSQSGGVTTALLIHLFETIQIEAAVVAIMQTGALPRGDVLLVKSTSELMRAQKSKYTPIPLLKVIQDIKKIQGPVALVGLPCHMHGLHNLTDMNPDLAKKQFFKIGLICDRIMTTAAINFMSNRATHEPISDFVFRDKLFPSYPGSPVVKKASGEKVVLKASFRIAIKDFFTPVRCRLCFDKLNVFADVVLGDPHGVNDADKIGGETLVFSRNEKGQQLIREAKLSGFVTLRECDWNVAITGQGVDKKRKEWAGFMRAWEEMGKQLPRYPYIQITCAPVQNHKKMLMDALSLDKNTREAVLNAAGWWLLRRKFYNFILWFIDKSKTFTRNILNMSKR